MAIDTALTTLQKAPGDVSNFDSEFTKEQPTLTPVHGQLTEKDQMEFNGFSWVCTLSTHVILTNFGLLLGGCVG